MADDVAVLDAPEISAEPSTDISTDTSSSDTGDTGDNSGGEPSVVLGDVANLRGGELYRAVKDKLKELDPKLARSIRNAIHMADKVDRASGGDLDSFQKRAELVSRLSDGPETGQTPEQVIESTLAERAFWRDFDSKFETGDPGIIQQMAEVNPESFQKLITPAISKFAELNPEGYSAMIAQPMLSYFNQQEIPLQFQILKTFLPNMPDFAGKQNVIEALDRIYATMESLKPMAAKPIAPKSVEGQQKPSGGLDQREQTVQQRELMLQRREWDGETSRPGIELRDAEMTRIASSQKVTLTAQEQAKIKAAVNQEIEVRLAAQKSYGQAMRGYLESGNKKAYMDRARSEYQKLIPTATKRAVQDVIDARKANPVKTQPARQNANQNQPSRTQTQGDGLTKWLSGHPKAAGKQIDYSRTTNGMLLKKEAYLKGEKGMYKWK